MMSGRSSRDTDRSVQFGQLGSLVSHDYEVAHLPIFVDRYPAENADQRRAVT